MLPNDTLKTAIEETLRTVYDPEIPVNIIELGLVYAIEVKDNGIVFITMTLTAPACPVAGDIVREVEEKVNSVSGVKEAHIQLTFTPAWTKDRMSEEARLELGFM